MRSRFPFRGRQSLDSGLGKCGEQSCWVLLRKPLHGGDQKHGRNHHAVLHQFQPRVAPPLEWEANIQTFDLANVPSMQYGNLSSNINSTWVKYEAAAWLITQLTQTSNKYQQAVDQYAARRTKLPITSQWPLWVADSPPTSRRHTTMLLAPSPADMSPPDGKW